MTFREMMKYLKRKHKDKNTITQQAVKAKGQTGKGSVILGVVPHIQATHYTHGHR